MPSIFLSSFSFNCEYKWLLMHYSQKQSLLPQFSPLMCFLFLWWYNQSKRGEKRGSAETEEFRGWLFSREHRALIPKGDPALFWNTLSLPVDRATNSSFNTSVIDPLCHRCYHTHQCQDNTLGLPAPAGFSSNMVNVGYSLHAASRFTNNIFISRFTWRHKCEKCLRQSEKGTGENNLGINPGMSLNSRMQIWQRQQLDERAARKMKGSQSCCRNKWAEAFHDSYWGFILLFSQASDPKCWIGLCISGFSVKLCSGW